ncbi:type II toxin-antitoxin system VapC family toxin [Mesorhizobium sp. CN2-181]|uniref:type II toxin-antitoxin system VapC family toxin n=1 Tax=Mesorhizobium yinganensis TaxID=3157707 RepID=UPI0032B7FDA1
MIVFDTNVLSALMMPERNAAIVEWADGQPAESIWTTAVCVLEIRTGILFLPDGRRKERLGAGFSRLLREQLSGRILPFDADAAERAAGIAASRTLRGSNVGTWDIQIAGIVIVRNATLATRNTKDFGDLDIRLVNPWNV